MGYLSSDTNEIIIDAVLTKEGRQKLAAQGNLGITKFALSDDEIDYSLYNVDSPLGTDYYDIAIRKMPVLEAMPASVDSLKYKLFTNEQNATDTSVLALRIDAPAKIRNSDGTLGTGIDDHSNYTINVGLTNGDTLPAATKSQIFYVAKLTSFQGRGTGDIIFVGQKDQADPAYSAMVTAQRELDTQNNLQTTQKTQIGAAGKSFIFQVKNESSIREALQFKVLFTAAGPVSSQPSELIIPVNAGINAVASAVPIPGS